MCTAISGKPRISCSRIGMSFSGPVFWCWACAGHDGGGRAGVVKACMHFFSPVDMRCPSPFLLLLLDWEAPGKHAWVGTTDGMQNLGMEILVSIYLGYLGSYCPLEQVVDM